MDEPATRDPIDIAADKPKLLSSTMLMAAGTLASRFLGMIRVLLVGYLFATFSRQVEIFTVATEIPTTAYMLLAGGVLNAILVPQLMRARQRDEDGGQAYSDRIVTLFLLLVGALTLLLIICAPWVVRLLTHPDWHSPALTSQYSSMITLAALCMPQIFFYGAFFLGGQILNAHGSFGPLMWAPALNNVIQIAMLGTYAIMWGFNTDTAQAFSTAQVLLLGGGSVIGVLCQALVLIPFLRKVGFQYHPRFDFLHTGLGATAHMAKWALALVALDQVNFLIITKLASGAAAATGRGAGMTVFNNAMLVSLLPHALLTVSLATALLPSLSRLSAKGDWPTFTERLTSNLRLVYTAIIPVSLLFVAIGVPVATLAWSVEKGGEYIGWTLVVLGAALIPFTLRFMVNKAFNSMENTRTPFFVEILFVGLTCLVSILLVAVVKVRPAWVAPSVALGYGIGYVGSAWLAWVLLRRSIPGMTERIAPNTIRLLLLSIPGALVAAAVCWVQTQLISGFFAQLIGVVIAIILGCGVYWGVARLARIPEIIDLEAMIGSRLRKETPVEPGASSPSDAHDAMPETPLAPDIPVLQPGDIPILQPPDQSSDPSLEQVVDEPTTIYSPTFGADETQPILTGLAPLLPGALIAGRYRLQELVGRVGQATRWTGTDESLSRPIFLTAFANDETTLSVLEAARAASGAMDARFLRILDAGQDADGAYVVSEWAPARTLSEVLAAGPLTGEESAWVVREVAAALASVHSMQLYHCRLDPSMIYLSTAGSVKIAGFVVNRALTPRPNDDQLSRKDMEAMDVAACGGILYACLTATWPGAIPVGLPRSPRDPDGLRSPIRVRPGTSPALDRLTHQILSLHDPQHLDAARQIAEAMGTALGSKEVTASLIARVEATPASTPANGYAPAAPTDETTSSTAPIAQQPRIVGADQRVNPVVVPLPGAADVPSPQILGGEDGAYSAPTVGIAPLDLEESSRRAKPLRAPIPPKKARLWSRVSLILLLLVVLSLITALIVGLYNSARTPDAPIAPATPTGPITHPIAGAAVFDPAGDAGDESENNELLPLSYDSNPDTAWVSEEYGQTYIPNQKPGVGVLYDLGHAVPVSTITIQGSLHPLTVTVYVPQGDPSTVVTPDMSTIGNWTGLTSTSLTDNTTNLDIPATTTQYVVLYFTVLAPSGEFYQADLAEVSFTG